MKRECLEYPIAEFVNQYPELLKNRVKLYVDLEHAQEIADFLSIKQHAQKFRRILYEQKIKSVHRKFRGI